jgi:hypothetical protein
MNTTQVKIEKNIPLPSGSGGRGKPKSLVRIAMETMDISDSFVTDSRSRKMVGSISILINRKFTTRKIADNQYRVWRIE